MVITKYEHACLVIEEQGKHLIIDPGIFSNSLPDIKDVEAVIVTHVHPDHFDPNRLKQIFASNPDCKLYTVQAVANELKNEFSPQVVTGGVGISCGPFNLEFFGGTHAIIHESYPTTDNVGVLVNETLYYPGDSFSKPDKPVTILAVPASAPWMRVGEAIDFIAEIKPKQVFPTHNAVLSDEGMTIHNRMLEVATKKSNGAYMYLKPGESTPV